MSLGQYDAEIGRPKDYGISEALSKQDPALKENAITFGRAFQYNNIGKYVLITETAKGKWQVDAYALSFWGKLVAKVWRAFGAHVLDGEDAHKELAKNCHERLYRIASKIKVKNEDDLNLLRQFQATVQALNRDIKSLELGNVTQRVAAAQREGAKEHRPLISKGALKAPNKEMNLEESEKWLLVVNALVKAKEDSFRKVLAANEVYVESRGMTDQITSLAELLKALNTAKEKDAVNSEFLREYQGKIAGRVHRLILEIEKKLQTFGNRKDQDFKDLDILNYDLQRLKSVIENNRNIVGQDSEDRNVYEGSDHLESNEKWAAKIDERVEKLLKPAVATMNERLTKEAAAVDHELNEANRKIAGLHKQTEVNNKRITAQEQAEKTVQSSVTEALKTPILKYRIFHETAKALKAVQAKEQDIRSLRHLDRELTDVQTSLKAKQFETAQFENSISRKITELTGLQVSPVSDAVFKEETQIWRELLTNVYQQIYQIKIDKALKQRKEDWSRDIGVFDDVEGIIAEQRKVRASIQELREYLAKLKAGTYFPRDQLEFARQLPSFVKELGTWLSAKTRSQHKVWAVFDVTWPEKVKGQFPQFTKPMTEQTVQAMAGISAAHADEDKVKLWKTLAANYRSDKDKSIEELSRLKGSLLIPLAEQETRVRLEDSKSYWRREVRNTQAQIELLEYMINQKKAASIKPELEKLLTVVDQSLAFVKQKMALYANVEGTKHELGIANTKLIELQARRDTIKLWQQRVKDIRPGTANTVFKEFSELFI